VHAREGGNGISLQVTDGSNLPPALLLLNSPFAVSRQSSLQKIVKRVCLSRCRKENDCSSLKRDVFFLFSVSSLQQYKEASYLSFICSFNEMLRPFLLTPHVACVPLPKATRVPPSLCADKQTQKGSQSPYPKGTRRPDGPINQPFLPAERA